MVSPGWLRRLTPFDRKLLMIVLLGIGLSFLLPLRRGAGSRVVVSSDDKVVFVAPLDRPREVSLAGPLGQTDIAIEKGSVRVVSSPCPSKTCIRMGVARHAGDLIACVPNHLIIRIEGRHQENTTYDLISR